MTDLPPRAELRRPRAFKITPDRPIGATTTEVAETAEAPLDGVASDATAERPAWRERPRVLRPSARVEFEEQPDPYAREAAAVVDGMPSEEVAIEVAQRRGMVARGLLSWGGLFWSALGGLVSLAVGLWITRLIDDLFARVPGLGWVGVALAALAALALVGLAVREALGVARQRHVAVLHKRLADAHAADDRDAARSGIKDLASVYAARPETARARQDLAALSTEIIDGRDLIDLAERHLMGPLDALAQREIALAAKRVSVVTAISPRAILDVVFVIGQTVRLIRRIAEIYSGRPGLLGFVRLAKSVGAHLAITGGMAVGDSILQQVVGHGIAAKLSARLGEGVLNGLLTTRVGLSAMAVCRPMPFAALKQPALRDVAPFLFGGDKSL
ncbi:YcjF family protein [Lichenihabitans psoromatis]|uniref:YcjF family protein n=1 Tax=Lichenihabitans psoromatis TaxID=2528642 RepID=UPI00103563BC|nr:TIGR01620 family protein [Lichenihabitans psoromatis]